MANYSLKQTFVQFSRKILAWVKANCVNNLVSDATNLPLAAAQGKKLQSEIDTLNSNLIKILISNAQLINKAIDYNTFTESGLYVFDGGAMYKCQNAPDQQNTNCFVLILTFRPRRTVQIIFPGNVENFYYRSSVVDSDNWTTWKKF